MLSTRGLGQDLFFKADLLVTGERNKGVIGINAGLSNNVLFNFLVHQMTFVDFLITIIINRFPFRW